MTANPFKSIRCLPINFESMVKSAFEFSQGIKICSPNLLPGTKFYRCRITDQPLENISELGAPPKDIINKNGRLNLAGESVGYFSFSHRTSIFEVNPVVGDVLYLTNWELIKEIYICHIGYAKKQFDEWDSKKSPHRYKWVIDTSELNEQEVNKYNILSDIVTGDRPPYLKSNAVGKVLMTRGLHAGLLYPSIAHGGNADNIAIKEEFLDIIYLNWIEVVRITKLDNGSVSYERVKWSDTWDSNGYISWKELTDTRKEGGYSLIYQ